MSRLFSGECSLILVISDYMSCNSSLFTVCCWGVGWLCSVWVQEVMPSPLTLYCGPFQRWHWALYEVPVWGMSILTWHLGLGLVLWCSVTSRPSTELGSGIALSSELHELVAKGLWKNVFLREKNVKISTLAFLLNMQIDMLEYSFIEYV